MNRVLGTSDENDSRALKAAVIAAHARQWIKIRTHSGKKYFGIRGSDGTIYFVNKVSCTCADHRNRNIACKHILAVRIYCAKVLGEVVTQVAA